MFGQKISESYPRTGSGVPSDFRTDLCIGKKLWSFSAVICDIFSMRCGHTRFHRRMFPAAAAVVAASAAASLGCAFNAGQCRGNWRLTNNHNIKVIRTSMVSRIQLTHDVVTSRVRLSAAAGDVRYSFPSSSVRHFCSATRPLAIFIKFYDTPNPDCLMFVAASPATHRFLTAPTAEEEEMKDPAVRKGAAVPTAPRWRGAMSMIFTRDNQHQSPLAAHIFAITDDIVDDITIGERFVTVRRRTAADLALARTAATIEDDDDEGRRGGEETDDAERHRGGEGLPDVPADGVRPPTSPTPPPPSSLHEAGSRDGALAIAHDEVVPPSPPGNSAASGVGAPPASWVHVKSATLPPSLDDVDAAPPPWGDLAVTVCTAIMEHSLSGTPCVDPSAPHPHSDTLPDPGDSEVVLCVKEVIATTIRPEVQKDGGDIRFVKYDYDDSSQTGSRDVHVQLLGACRSCRKSSTTLKDLIERTMRHFIPEINGVVEWKDSSSGVRGAATVRNH